MCRAINLQDQNMSRLMYISQNIFSIFCAYPYSVNEPLHIILVKSVKVNRSSSLIEVGRDNIANWEPGILAAILCGRHIILPTFICTYKVPLMLETPL